MRTFRFFLLQILILFPLSKGHTDEIKKMKIMPLGDSITFGINYPGAYRIRLAQLLDQSKIDFSFVGSQSNGPDSLTEKANEGHPGKGIDFFQENISEWMHLSSPDMVLLMLGTNDVWPNNPNDVIQIKNLVTKMKLLIETMIAERPDVKIIVSSIPPSLDYWNKWVAQFNEELKLTVIDAYSSKKVLFVDSNQKFKSSDFDMNDGMGGIHPNRQGYDKIGESFFSVPDFFRKK